MRLRGRVWVMERKGAISEQEYLSPMDNSKVYVYSARGRIVRSAEFYEKFAFEWAAEQN